MKFKSKPGSKIPTTQTNTNKKKGADIVTTPKQEDVSLIKKNEFALILFGALLLTVIVFFFFFKSSDSKIDEIKKSVESPSYIELEKRILSLEQTLETQKTGEKAGDKNGGKKGDIDLLTQRVTRLETAFSVKFDSVIERIAGMEKNIVRLKEAPAKVVVKAPVKKSVVKAPAKKVSTVPVKTALKKKAVFHTVQKKETLYSISKKYNTTVGALRKLNNLSATATIYPGDNILVK